jgi:hypothetical protein
MNMVLDESKTNPSYWKMEIISQILALMKMVLDASKTNH